MANLTAFQSFNMLASDDYVWTPTTVTASRIVTIANGGSISDEFTGSFTFPADGSVNGTMTGFKHFENGNQVFAYSGNLDAYQVYYHAIATGDTQSTYSYAFSGNDNFMGSSSNDTLKGYSGDDVIDGGAGSDIAAFSGQYADYTITKNANGSIQVLDKNAYRDGTDTLNNIETLKFSDQSIATDSIGNSVFVPSSPTYAATQGYLAGFGVSMSAASSFIISNLSNPQYIYDVCKSVGVTNQMIADIVSDVVPNITAVDVIGFFAQYGISTTDLDTGNASPSVSATTVDVHTLMHDESFTVSLDAADGAYTFVFDMSAKSPADIRGNTVNIDSTTTLISNYGSDDSIRILNSDGVYFTSTSSTAKTITVFGLKSEYEQIKLIGVTGSVYDIASFNALSVGDITIG